ncbi:MAG: hypothetical protein ACYC54_15455 [Sedimentisphaerales bacterium]
MKTFRFQALLIVAIVSIFCFSIELRAEIAVTSSGWRSPEVEKFPPESPPPNLKDADADATPSVSINGKITKGTYTKKDGKFKPTKVVVDVNGVTKIREPNNCDPNLHGHEMGHDQLNEGEFEKNAVKKVEDALKGFDEMEFTGDGNTPGERFKSAQAKANAELKRRLDAAWAAIVQQMDVVNDKFDKITDHGANEDPNTAKGVEEAQKEKANAANSGDTNVVPRTDSNSPSGTGMGGASTDPNGKLQIPMPIPLSDSNNPLDPINGRGQAKIDKMIVIGTQNNNTLHLSDTNINIIDSMDPSVNLMEAFIFNICYRPSNRQGFAGMIQGYLDIPPSIYGGGVNNTIGSPWLNKMQTSADQGEYMCFWFYSLNEMFDENGNWLLGPAMAQGQLVLGIGKEIFDEIDRFEQYSPVSFHTQWQHIGNGITELMPTFGHSSNKSMMLMYDTIAPPMFSAAIHTFMPPANWTSLEHKVLEVHFDLSQSPVHCIDNVYVELQDTVGHTYRSGYFTSAEYDQIILSDLSTNWESLNIDLRDAAAHGLMLNSIANIKIGVANIAGPPSAGIIFVDDIRIQNTRQLGEQKYDLTGDGIINFSDFAIFAGSWLSNTIWPN